MNINLFKQHLHHIDGALYRTTKTKNIQEDAWSGTNSNDPGIGTTSFEESPIDIEAEIVEYLNNYFGEAITENTSDEDLMEAFENINIVREVVNEYVETGNEELEGFVSEYLENYFDGSLTEDISINSIEESIINLNELCEMVNLFLESM